MRTIAYSILFLLALAATACRETVTPAVTDSGYPPIFPDYIGVTVPATIAPLNFTVTEPFSRIDVLIAGTDGHIHMQETGSVQFPAKDWAALLAKAAGDSLKVTVSIQQESGWKQYAPFPIYVSPDPIDETLVYRRIAPGYEVYSQMGIYQRTLSDFTETALLENTLIPGSCVNCHSFCQNAPDPMSLHLRGENGATILTSGGKSELLNTKTDQTLASCVYPYWHPSGKYIAYSVNKTQQAFHAAKDQRVEVVDLASDVVIYNVEKNELFSCPALKSDSAFETFPAFSPDGRTLYFCTAVPRAIPAAYDQIQYSLCSIGFDPDNGTFAKQVDTLVSAAALHKSVSFPRPSPDGKRLMYALSDYGNFSIWHKEADLWLIELPTRTSRELTEVNSPDTESYHSWSSNSRWFVFSSRRIDGLYTRPYIASIDAEGRIKKPFLLPQEGSDYYDQSLYSFNIPEFVTGAVKLNVREVEKKALSPYRKQVTYQGNQN